MRRAQLLLLIFTGLWVVTFGGGLILALIGTQSPGISSEQGDLSTYPPFYANWDYQVGFAAMFFAWIAFLVDGAVRILLLVIGGIVRRRRRRDQSTRPRRSPTPRPM